MLKALLGNLKEKPVAGKADEVRLEYGYRIIRRALWLIAGFFVLTVLAYVGLTFGGKSAPHELYTVLTLVIGAVGTIVGFLFGHHAGAAGKEKAEEKRDKAIAALINKDGNKAAEILKEG